MRNFLLRKVIICLFSLNLYASDLTIEEMDKNIDQARTITFKQLLMCEREVFTVISNDNSNPEVCLKAVEYLKNIKETDQDTKVYVETFGWDYFKEKNPNYDKSRYVLFYEDFNANYQLYLEKYKTKKIAGSYLNAGILYQFSKKNQSDKKAFEMYKKSYDNGECNLFDSCGSALNLGYLYLVGAPGIEKNLALGYKYTKESAEKGNQQAIKNLKHVCSVTPWICK